MFKILQARKARGWTQKQLAESINTTQQTIDRWERGITEPKVSDLQRISNALGITLSFLLGIDETEQEEQLFDNERELLSLYRQLSPKAKDALIAGLKAYTE